MTTACCQFVSYPVRVFSWQCWFGNRYSHQQPIFISRTAAENPASTNTQCAATRPQHARQQELHNCSRYLCSTRRISSRICQLISTAVECARTELDLVLPPTEAFCPPGLSLNHCSAINTDCLMQGSINLIFPPLLGQRGVNWTDVFSLIKRPGLLWEVWKPMGTLDSIATVSEMWDFWKLLGQPVRNEQGVITGMTPPLSMVEAQFGASWRKSPSVSLSQLYVCCHFSTKPTGSQNLGALSRDPQVDHSRS